MNYVIKPTENDIQHHGVLGQKWGKRQGPPYPLDGSDHSAAEKKAGWINSLKTKHVENKKKKYINKNLGIVGENTKKVDEELRNKVSKTKEYKEYSKAQKELDDLYSEFTKEHPKAQLLVPKEVKQYYDNIAIALNNKVANIITDNAGKYAVAKLKDMKISDFTEKDIEYTKKMIIKNKII